MELGNIEFYSNQPAASSNRWAISSGRIESVNSRMNSLISPAKMFGSYSSRSVVFPVTIKHNDDVYPQILKKLALFNF